MTNLDKPSDSQPAAAPQGQPPVADQNQQAPPPQGYAPPPQGYAPPPQGYAPPPQGYAPPPQGYPPQGYPPQGYPPQGYAPPSQGYPPQGYYAPPQGAPQQQYMQPAVVVQQAPVLIQAPIVQFREVPVDITCGHCQARVTTKTHYESGGMCWLVCFILILFGCWLGCCLIPFGIDSLKDVRHECPSCKATIYKSVGRSVCEVMSRVHDMIYLQSVKDNISLTKGFFEVLAVIREMKSTNNSSSLLKFYYSLLVIFIIYCQSCYVVVDALPTINSVESNGNSISIYGIDFGIAINEVTITFSTQSLLELPPTTLVSNGANSLVTFTPTVPILNGQVMVAVAGWESNYYSFTLKPVISISSPRPSALGGSANFQGYFINKLRANGQPTNFVLTIGSNVINNAALTYSTTGTYLNTTGLPRGTGTIASTLSIDGVVTSFDMTYAAPTFTLFVTSQNLLAVQGSNFGNVFSLISVHSVNYPSISFNATSISTDNIRFLATVPDNAWTDNYYIKVDGQISNSRLVSFTPWLLTCTQIPTAGGAVTITGHIMSHPTIPQLVKIRDNIVCPVTFGNGSMVVFTAPAGGGSNVAVILFSSTPIYTSYYSPIIDSVVQQPNGQLLIVGQYFGTPLTVMVGDIAYLSLVSKNADQTNMTIVPSPASRNGAVKVIIADLISNLYTFTLQPIITSVTSVDTIGGQVTIIGSFLHNLRQDGSTAPVSIAFGSAAPTPVSSWSNDTGSYIVVNVAEGVGKNIPVSVTVDGKQSNQGSFSYNPPTITSVTQSSTGINIHGSNFGVSTSTTMPIVNNKDYTPNTSIVTQTEITVSLGANEKNGYVSVVVGGQLATSNITLELEPVISSTGPVSLYGGTFTISGRYLNNQDYLGNTIPLSVELGLNTQCTSPVTTGTQVTCQYTKGLGGADANIVLTIGNKQTSTFVSFPAPTLSSISPTQDVTDDSITMFGTNFGTRSDQIFVFIGQDAGSVTGLASDSLVFKINPNSKSGPAKVRVFGQDSNTMEVVISPIITSVDKVATGGGTISILGQHFNQFRSNNTQSSISIRLNSNPPSSSGFVVKSSSVIEYGIPAGTGKGQSLTLTIDGQSSSIVFNYPVPVLYNVNQVQQSQAHYTTGLTIFGSSFGTVKENVQFLFKNQLTAQFQPVTMLLDSAIQVALPTFAKNDKILVNVSNQLSNEIDLELYPILKSITSADSVGGEIKIGGLYLNNQTANGTVLPITVVFPGNVPCTNIQKIADDQDMSYITCMAPPGTGITNSVVVTVGQRADTINFAYGAPVIFDLIVSDTNSVSIIGKNFGTAQSGITVNLGATTQSFSFVNSTLLLFTADPSSTKSGPITVTLTDGRVSNPVQLHLTPIITSVSKPVKTNGDQLTIVGSFLNPTRLDGSSTNITIIIDQQQQQQCTNPVASGSTIVCTSPQGSGTNHNIRVYIDGVASPTSVQFSYIAPLISGIVQRASSNEITIYGTNFGGSDLTKISINNDIKLESIVNPTMMNATLQSASKNGNIRVVVDGQTSNNYLLNIKPLVSFISSASPFGGVVEIVGKYLWTVRSNGTFTEITIKIGGLDCLNISTTVDDGTSIQCSIGAASLYQQAVLVTIDSIVGDSGSLEYTSLDPVITSIDSTYFKVPGQVVFHGDHFYGPTIDIQIGDTPCTNGQIVDRNTVTCDFDSLIGSNASQPLDVYVKCGNLDVTVEGIYKYRVLECLNSCSSPNNGQCLVNGQCKCVGGYTGSDCSIPFTKSVTSTPTTTVSGGSFVAYNSTVEFLLSHIQEIRENGTVVKTISLIDAKWDILDENSSASVIIYNNTVIGQYNIELVVSSFNQSSDHIIQFAGDEIAVPSNSIKHNIIINSYTFESETSSLLVIYRFKSPTQLDYDCKTKDTTYQFDTSSSSTLIKSYSIDSPLGTMIASFSNRAIVDDTNQIVTSIQAVASIDSTTKSSAGVQYVGIRVPSFENFVEIDPVFSATLKTTPPPIQECTVSSSSSTSIPSIFFSFFSFIIFLIVFN
ncbi:IPT/TIG domain-containing protein [Cavenderia fasciculata]|uniref:IPT/TIG domain-containing protein n=1 Tax=Cavenderia fasciculata TaxID=261658 RepID=F4PGK3_CACFS|nr:IPT/TIG domain-containing protein [Cavenderia fasciculata]EGG24837.1 IPT/TIG domain-containing protein [Cavenderia fasciculata]|eukprot:XP_004362688.1 IPT/TIG domain-containing protein [Cavenderia fasciculata]